MARLNIQQAVMDAGLVAGGAIAGQIIHEAMEKHLENVKPTLRSLIFIGGGMAVSMMVKDKQGMAKTFGHGLVAFGAIGLYQSLKKEKSAVQGTGNSDYALASAMYSNPMLLPGSEYSDVSGGNYDETNLRGLEEEEALRGNDIGDTPDPSDATDIGNPFDSPYAYRQAV